ncbi:hypothetical protein BGZ57DRAFT_934498 [Hyaloscypha finlandica]|nr:hypothetical protein BGZ57DRAFT_934498 [Hyaloscypha finlandica]
MSHHQNLQHSGFVPYPSHHPVYPDSIDSDSHDSLPTKGRPFGDENTVTDEHFFLGDLDLEQLDPWRRDVPSPMPRIADAITQALAEAALSPLSPTIYSPWDGDFAPPAPGLDEYATMQAQSRGRGPATRHLLPLPRSLVLPPNRAHPALHTNLHVQRPFPHTPASPPPTSNPIRLFHDERLIPAPLSDAEAEAKRIRNTAASARFRRKKKAREASLERQSREKREALAKLENRITELEDENKFLKGLILWKREGREEDEGKEVEDSIVVESERKWRERKDGVGT